MTLAQLSLGKKLSLLASLVFGAVVLGFGLVFRPAWQVSFIEHYGSPAFYSLILFVTVLFTSAAFTWLARLFVDKPLRELIGIMEHAEQKDFLFRAPVRTGDVIGKLAKTFNQLLERITTLDAFKMETERHLIIAQEELKYKTALEDKNRIIESKNIELKDRVTELSLLHDFSQKISATLEPDELYTLVGDFFQEFLRVNEFCFLVCEEERKELVVKMACGFPDVYRIQGLFFKPGEGVTGRVLEKEETLYIPDTETEHRFLYYKGEQNRDGSFLCIPLLFKSHLVGAISFMRRGRYQFSSEEIRFIETLSMTLAMALVNARQYSRTKELSVRDELTQLYNKRHFHQILPLEIKRAQRFGKPLSLIMMDLDFFKELNDHYGHLAGDKHLQDFVNLLRGHLREVDFFARFGGDEFVIILSNTSSKDAVKVAHKLQNLVKMHKFSLKVMGHEIHDLSSSVSIGVATFPQDADSLEGLLDAADKALYAAKDGGRSQVAVYSDELSPPKPLHHAL